MFSDGENVSIGQPALEDIVVEGHIVEQGKAKKIIVFKYKKRKRYRRKKGHRQEFTAVLIDDIKPKAQKLSETKDEPKAEAKKPEAEKAAPKKAEAESESPKKEATMKAETTAVPAEEAESEQETE
jgi:hypothetical protein